MATDEYLESIGSDSVISTYKEMTVDSAEYPKSFMMHCKLHYISACNEKGMNPSLENDEIEELNDYFEQSEQEQLSHEAYSCIAKLYAQRHEGMKAIAFYDKAIDAYQTKLRRIHNLDRKEEKILLMVSVPSICIIAILCLVIYNIKCRQRQIREQYKLMLLKRIEQEQAERSEKNLNEAKERVAKLNAEIDRAASSNNQKQTQLLKKQKDDYAFYLEKTERDIEVKKEQKRRLLQSDVFGLIQAHLEKDKNINAAVWEEIDGTVNSVVPDFKIQLYSSCKLSKLEYHICLLIRFSFSVREMAILLSRSDSAISLARKRLYKKLTGTDGTAKDLDAFVCSL